MMKTLTFLLAVICMNLAGKIFSQQINNHYDFSLAKIVIAEDLSDTERAALQMLVEEVRLL